MPIHAGRRPAIGQGLGQIRQPLEREIDRQRLGGALDQIRNLPAVPSTMRTSPNRCLRFALCASTDASSGQRHEPGSPRNRSADTRTTNGRGRADDGSGGAGSAGFSSPCARARHPTSPPARSDLHLVAHRFEVVARRDSVVLP
jgi:hypothetical protein